MYGLAIKCCPFPFCVLQEAEAFSLYNKALELQKQGDLVGAQKVLNNILDINVVFEVCLDGIITQHRVVASISLMPFCNPV